MKINRLNEVPSGLMLLNKAAGVTSFDALREIKQGLGTGKVGHTGTLDKFAEGLLLVLSGRALKLSTWFSHCDKRYRATVLFGAETDTLDPEGTVIAQAELPSRSAIENALPRFSGEILQTPPAYSAIHIDGKRASALARQGQTPEMKQRSVHIYKLELLEWNPPCALLDVHCSSGTYIRSLARDLAIAAGSRAHLHSLQRTQVAGFVPGDGDVTFSPISKATFQALGIPWFEIAEHEAPAIVQGKPLGQALAGKQLKSAGLYMRPGGSGTQAAAIFCGDSLIAVIEKEQDSWKYGYVYAHT